MGETHKSLECPFTWGIDEDLAREFDESQEIVVEVEEQPVLALVNSLSITYFLAVQKSHRDALNKLHESQEIFKQLDKRTLENDATSHEVLEHITQATAYHVHTLLDMTSEAKKAMSELKDSKALRSKPELGSIYGCRSIAWSCFHEAGCQRVVPLAEAAVSSSPTCSLWHHILGKSLRHVRRNVDGLHKPSPREKSCLLRSYELSPIPFYGIHVAQMYRESEEREKCRKIYSDIYESRPTSVGINLRLGKAFTTFNDFVKAEECLNRAGEKNQQNPMYLHYKGCLYRKEKKLKEAAVYLKEAGKNGNHRADFDYAEVMMRLSRGSFDYLGHLQRMFEKCENVNFKQTILLHISMQSYYKKTDLDSALKNLLKAIELNPDSKQLMNFRNISVDWNEYLNIFDLVSDVLLPLYLKRRQELSADMKDVVKSLKHHCEKQRNELSASFQGMTL
ncbi:uncharacterized protein LOC103315534 isoform X2 [Nasonia vitripennis]|nr:uncharacterized protein LOC103315534 isoform X2 [Nasonia vitripennis]XP_032456840.1 uncharacterized protein LOC103315534 isoform X2 [Nasonia vitripennis]